MFVRGRDVENKKLQLCRLLLLLLLLPPPPPPPPPLLLLLMSCRNSDVLERAERAVDGLPLPPRGLGTTAAAAFQQSSCHGAKQNCAYMRTRVRRITRRLVKGLR